VHGRRLADDVLDPHARVERGHRVLEDHLDLQRRLARIRPPEFGDVAAAIEDAPLARLKEPGDHPPDGRLAGTGFADEPTTSPWRDVEIDAVDGVDLPGMDARAQPGGDLSAKSSFFSKRLDTPCSERMGSLMAAPQGLQMRVAAARFLARPDRPHRLRLAALIEGARAARAEGAALGQVEQRRRHAGDLGEFRAARLRLGTEPISPTV
jgi:hypothetical protein